MGRNPVSLIQVGCDIIHVAAAVTILCDVINAFTKITITIGITYGLELCITRFITEAVGNKDNMVIIALILDRSRNLAINRDCSVGCAKVMSCVIQSFRLRPCSLTTEYRCTAIGTRYCSQEGIEGDLISTRQISHVISDISTLVIAAINQGTKVNRRTSSTNDGL